MIGGVTLGGWSAVTDSAILDRLKAAAKTNVRRHYNNHDYIRYLNVYLGHSGISG